jgi:hypothetical protein
MAWTYRLRKRTIRVASMPEGSQATSGTDALLTEDAARRMYPALFEMPKPRPVRMVWRGWYYHALFLFVGGWAVLSLREEIRSSPTGTIRLSSADWFSVLLVIGYLYWGYRLARSWMRDRQLLENGDMTGGIVIDESPCSMRGLELLLFLRFRPRSIRFQYRDPTGMLRTGRGMDHADDHFEGAPILVFFDRFEPSHSRGPRVLVA